MVTGGSAWHVALRRAAHQLYDDPPLIIDPFALPLLGSAGADALLRTPQAAHRAWSRSLRAFAVARSCFAEQQLAVAVHAGVQQYCVLGAGLDTFALRNPWPSLRVIEVDRPEMIALKATLLRDAAIALPKGLSQFAADLEYLQRPIDGLDAAQPAFFSLLGVAPYLPASALHSILARVIAQGPGSGIVLDYRLPRALLSHEERQQHDSLAGRVAAAGEPLVSAWSPSEMAALLSGFSRHTQLDAQALNERYFAKRTDGLQVLGSVVRQVSAWV